mgnify:CR=1 FL=1
MQEQANPDPGLAGTKTTLVKEEVSGLYAFNFRNLGITGVSLKELRQIHADFAAICDSIGCPCFEAGYDLASDRAGQADDQ